MDKFAECTYEYKSSNQRRPQVYETSSPEDTSSLRRVAKKSAFVANSRAPGKYSISVAPFGILIVQVRTAMREASENTAIVGRTTPAPTYAANDYAAPVSIIYLNDNHPKTVDVGPPPDTSKTDAAAAAVTYDPYEHGNQRRPIRWAGATFLLLKYIIGAGILAIPYTFRNVGYAVGVVGTVLIGFLYLHIIHVLLSVEYELCRRLRVPRLTYVGVVQKSFELGSPRVRGARPIFVALMYFNYLLGGVMGNAIYLIVMASSVRDIFNGQYTSDHGIHYFLSLLIVPLIVVCWIPNLKFLVPFSVLTSAFTLVNVSLILAMAVPEDRQPSEARAVGDLAYIPQFFAIVLGAYSCTGLVLPVKNDMAAPKRFASTGGVLNAAVSLVAVVYAFFGARAYLKYGDATQGNILTNLPGHRSLSTVVLATYTAAVAISFTYGFYITFDTLWSNYARARLKGHPRKLVVKYALKTAINVVTYALAVVVPNFALFAALSGSVGILADVGLPSALQIIVHMDEKWTGWRLANVLKNCAIIGVAITMFVSALTASVRDIVNFYVS